MADTRLDGQPVPSGARRDDGGWGPSVERRGRRRRPLRLFVLLLVALLSLTAYLLYADRKIWAAVQLRRGPNVVGPWGLLQSFADLLKFVLKEPLIPSSANKGLFLLLAIVQSRGGNS